MDFEKMFEEASRKASREVAKQRLPELEKEREALERFIGDFKTRLEMDKNNLQGKESELEDLNYLIKNCKSKLKEEE